MLELEFHSETIVVKVPSSLAFLMKTHLPFHCTAILILDCL